MVDAEDIKQWKLLFINDVLKVTGNCGLLL